MSSHSFSCAVSHGFLSVTLYHVKSRLLQLPSQLRKFFCASEGSMRSLHHRVNTATDLPSCFLFRVHLQVADFPVLRVPASVIFARLTSRRIRLRCFRSVVCSDNPWLLHIRQSPSTLHQSPLVEFQSSKVLFPAKVYALAAAARARAMFSASVLKWCHPASLRSTRGVTQARCLPSLFKTIPTFIADDTVLPLRFWKVNKARSYSSVLLRRSTGHVEPHQFQQDSR